MSRKKEHAAATETASVQEREAQQQPSDEKATPEAATDEPQEEEKSPEEVIEELGSELTTANERYLRLMAEFDNYKKRTSREYERMVESANEKLMLEMIGVRETFELALKHGENGTDYKQLFDGVKLIFNKFDGVLSANGLTPFAAIGDEFDPQIHDALLKVPHPELPEDHIADIHEKGYRLKDRVIKHARVIVSAGAPAPEESTTNEKK
ncbi:MAG: nucleotide exchange factor GrpE [Chitinispirillaceae bacterium]|nr:nucleotide exchange factor GrpE [Chitinispirillaceae bacterium]